MAREELGKRQQPIQTTTIMENFEIEVLGMITLMDADSLAYVCAILDLDVPEQKKGNLKPLSKYILRQFNSEFVEGTDDGGSYWYVKLYSHFRVSFSNQFIHL